MRCVELEAATQEEIEGGDPSHLAYIEDELRSHAQANSAVRPGRAGEQMAQHWHSEWSGVAVETLRSRYGAPGPANAGLLGYLESIARIDLTMGVRIPVNLASDPFRRDRPILVASVALGAVLLITLLVQIGADRFGAAPGCRHPRVARKAGSPVSQR